MYNIGNRALLHNHVIYQCGCGKIVDQCFCGEPEPKEVITFDGCWCDNPPKRIDLVNPSNSIID